MHPQQRAVHPQKHAACGSECSIPQPHHSHAHRPQQIKDAPEGGPRPIKLTLPSRLLSTATHSMFHSGSRPLPSARTCQISTQSTTHRPSPSSRQATPWPPHCPSTVPAQSSLKPLGLLCSSATAPPPPASSLGLSRSRPGLCCSCPLHPTPAGRATDGADQACCRQQPPRRRSDSRAAPTAAAHAAGGAALPTPGP